MPDFDVLEIHGTTIGGLTPGSIVTAAEYDLRRRTGNVEAGSNLGGNYAHYAFHRRHVKKATSARGLIEIALADRELGTSSGKKSTRLIYKDETLLREALKTAVDKEAAPVA